MKNFKEMYKKRGILNFKELTKQGYLEPTRDPKGQVVPVSSNFDGDVLLTVVDYGQCDRQSRLHGIGRKIAIKTFLYDEIMEG